MSPNSRSISSRPSSSSRTSLEKRRFSRQIGEFFNPLLFFLWLVPLPCFLASSRRSSLCCCLVDHCLFLILQSLFNRFFSLSFRPSASHFNTSFQTSSQQSLPPSTCKSSLEKELESEIIRQRIALERFWQV